jgi:hypothetical protein
MKNDHAVDAQCYGAKDHRTAFDCHVLRALPPQRYEQRRDRDRGRRAKQSREASWAEYLAESGEGRNGNPADEEAKEIFLDQSSPPKGIVKFQAQRPPRVGDGSWIAIELAGANSLHLQNDVALRDRGRGGAGAAGIFLDPVAGDPNALVSTGLVLQD